MTDDDLKSLAKLFSDRKLLFFRIGNDEFYLNYDEYNLVKIRRVQLIKNWKGNMVH